MLRLAFCLGWMVGEDKVLNEDDTRAVVLRADYMRWP